MVLEVYDAVSGPRSWSDRPGVRTGAQRHDVRVPPPAGRRNPGLLRPALRNPGLFRLAGAIRACSGRPCAIRACSGRTRPAGPARPQVRIRPGATRS